MMVYDDAADIPPLELGDRIDGRDAVIQSDDEIGFVIEDALKSRGAQTVPVLALGNQRYDFERFARLSLQQGEKSSQQGGRGHAVDVVIAEENDALIFLDRFGGACDGGGHIRKCLRLAQQIHAAGQKIVGALQIRNAAPQQNARADL